MATSGLDGVVKVWDMRNWQAVNTWSMAVPAQSLAFSQKGLLAVGWGGHVNVSRDSLPLFAGSFLMGKYRYTKTRP